MVNFGGLGPGDLDSWDAPYERDCSLRVGLESQTTGAPKPTILPFVDKIRRAIRFDWNIKMTVTYMEYQRNIVVHLGQNNHILCRPNYRIRQVIVNMKTVPIAGLFDLIWRDASYLTPRFIDKQWRHRLFKFWMLNHSFRCSKYVGIYIYIEMPSSRLHSMICIYYIYYMPWMSNPPFFSK